MFGFKLPRPALWGWPLLILAALFGCSTPPPEPPPVASFRAEPLAAMDQAIQTAIADHKCPGGVLWLEHRGQVYHRAYGQRALVPTAEAMTEDTIFDAASLTKVVATTPAVMLLIERGQLNLEAPVVQYLPEFTGGGREHITVRQLLTHTSGLPPDIETRTDWHGQAAAIQKACAIPLATPPGTMERYSDINFFLLGEVVQRVSKMPLEQFVAREIFQPLGMRDTSYLPPADKMNRIAPTEVVNGRPWRGIVHDPTARHMGGVAGHAGLFTTAADLARYARMLLNLGTLDGVRLMQAATVRLMTSVQTPPAIADRRGLGWDIDSAYSTPRGQGFPVGSYGHTGWTGGSLWIDTFSHTFLIFLSNCNHPTEAGNVIKLRARLGTLAAQAIPDFDFTRVPGALPARRPLTGATLNGIDVLERDHFAPLRGLRIGLITNQTGQDRNGRSTIDLLKKAPDVQLVALLSPEHGIRGMADEKVGDSMDPATGLPVYSLYGTNTRPTKVELQNLDALVFDLQDIGCRFYTYTTTLGQTMEAAAENHKRYFVLDRVNPINAATVAGPVLGEPPSFVGYHQVPLQYGLTLGELATLFQAERSPATDLTVIRLENWRRQEFFDQTGLPWINPSPNMRCLRAAILYPGVGLLESALSVGRGTPTPFEWVGAPYIDPQKLARAMKTANLPGVSFEPVQFTPTNSIHAGKLCGGVRITVTDRDLCPVVDVGLALALALQRLYPHDFQLNKMKRLLAHPNTLAALKAGRSLAEIHALWEPELSQYQARRAKYLLYP